MIKQFPSLSVIMPCLNEADNIAAAIQETLNTIDKMGIDAEIIVINDGSRDATAEIVKQLQAKEQRIKLLNHSKPQGVGASFWEGVQNAKNDFVTMIPGDNENDPEDVLKYYYLAKDIDIIIPFIMNIEIRSKIRRIISAVYRFIINISFGMSLNYTNGTVIYNRQILLDINLDTTGFLYQAELLIKLIRRGYFYAETPHLLSTRGSGKTKALTFSSLFNVIGSYLKLVWFVHISHRTWHVGEQLDKKSISYQRYQDNSPHK
jgi:glycosyltransferase involved in cell wall biosynthesis